MFAHICNIYSMFMCIRSVLDSKRFKNVLLELLVSEGAFSRQISAPVSADTAQKTFPDVLFNISAVGATGINISTHNTAS